MTEKELRKFIECLKSQMLTYRIRDISTDHVVNWYMNLLNSVPEDKAPALVPNEGKEKECQAGMRYSDCHIHSDSISGCLDCGNYR